MRVLHVISSLDPRAGGTVAAVVGLTTAQAHAGLEVGVLATHVAGETLETIEVLKRHGVKARSTGPVSGPLHRSADLAAAVDAAVAGAEVCMFTGFGRSAAPCGPGGAAAGGTVMVTPHGMLDPWSLSQSKWKKRIYWVWRLRRDLRRAAAIHFTAAGEQET